MRNKVLYYPYINVPRSNWFTRILLYWDEVGAIVPYDFIEDPNRLDKHMQSMVRAGLVTQVIPGEHLDKIPNYVGAFVRYLNSFGKELDSRRKSFKRALLKSHNTSRIHIEKMDKIGNVLEYMGLAKTEDSYWYDVEIKTGREFMSYLAATLGNLEELNFIPITDKLKHLENFVTSSSPDLEAEKKVAKLRLYVLEDLFPAPAHPLTASEIKDFKDEHGEKLIKFRNSVEQEITLIADINDPALQKRRLDLFKERTKNEIEEIKSHMVNKNFIQVVFSKFCTIVASLSPVLGVAKAVKEAFITPNKLIENNQFLYAAYAQEKLLKR